MKKTIEEKMNSLTIEKRLNISAYLKESIDENIFPNDYQYVQTMPDIAPLPVCRALLLCIESIIEVTPNVVSVPLKEYTDNITPEQEAIMRFELENVVDVIKMNQ